jgi:hypothetical protein
MSEWVNAAKHARVNPNNGVSGRDAMILFAETLYPGGFTVKCVNVNSNTSTPQHFNTFHVQLHQFFGHHP